MSFVERLSQVHLDILKEVGNIGAGNAATALSQLLNRTINLEIPTVQVATYDEMVELAGGSDHVVAAVYIRIEGEAPGNMFFVLPPEQVSYFVQLMTGDSTITFEEPPYSEMGISAFLEMGNILSGSYLSALSDFTRLNLQPSVPSASIDMAGAILTMGLIELSQVSDHVIVIDTILEEENSDRGKIRGHFFLLPDPDSFEKIFQALGVNVDE
ncbi:chemotaxis protein CheC [Melghiribacillus thermohalophilus]|uniref:Chemotaxis protein CheC n=1 Tax=Melghiribacillus thermohalophilus TaxID=1324956 RepID=A0A4R3NAU7_9BACI|nr:chemotaxis protein CheC [Melghiribacillus thermohalophilus]TCT26749.1 chemotaxis protein CheC [Melghiribacillus thermohalophilus]